MTRMQLGGGLLFVAALAAFLVLLPVLRQPAESSDSIEPVAEQVAPPPAAKLPAAEPGPAGSLALEAAELPAEEGDQGIEITLADMGLFTEGDVVSLFIPQEGQRYEGPVEEVMTTGAGNRVLTGFLGPPEQRQRFIFTVGESQTFGAIQTAQGRYQLETRNGSGRIISVSKINEKLDFSQPDYVIPAREEKRPATPEG